MDPTQPSSESSSDSVLPAAADNAEDRISQLEQAKRELEAQLAAAKRTVQEKPLATKPAGQSAPRATGPKATKTTKASQGPRASKKALPTAASLPAAKRAATANAARKPSPSQQNNPDESEPADSGTDSSWLGSRQVPAWAISMIVHLILFLILGLITIAIPATADFAIIAGSQDANEPLEQMAEVDIADELE
ncbi:MAG: hypothetical protein VYA08_12490, partial [Pseudomonadota bacterium]|nr:hypothetical protein [Pseudomonadota bacterium]